MTERFSEVALDKSAQTSKAAPDLGCGTDRTPEPHGDVFKISFTFCFIAPWAKHSAEPVLRRESLSNCDVEAFHGLRCGPISQVARGPWQP